MAPLIIPSPPASIGRLLSMRDNAWRLRKRRERIDRARHERHLDVVRRGTTAERSRAPATAPVRSPEGRSASGKEA